MLYPRFTSTQVFGFFCGWQSQTQQSWPKALFRANRIWAGETKCSGCMCIRWLLTGAEWLSCFELETLPPCSWNHWPVLDAGRGISSKCIAAKIIENCLLYTQLYLTFVQKKKTTKKQKPVDLLLSEGHFSLTIWFDQVTKLDENKRTSCEDVTKCYDVGCMRPHPASSCDVCWGCCQRAISKRNPNAWVFIFEYCIIKNGV